MMLVSLELTRIEIVFSSIFGKKRNEVFITSEGQFQELLSNQLKLL